MKRLAIIVPCYNEEEILLDTNVELDLLLSRLKKKKKVSSDSYILYVDDGSHDTTWSIIENFASRNKNIKGLKLASNVGHQNAIFAGLMYAKKYVDITITIDADLQDDVDVIEEMINKNKKGAEIVYGVRNDRQTDSVFKRLSAAYFYSFIQGSDSKTINNCADFRLMSSDILDELEKYGEYDLYLRGIVPRLGHKQDFVYYARKKREKGKSKYTLTKMIKLAMDGITASNATPLSGLIPFSFVLYILTFLFFLQIVYVFATTRVIPFTYSLMLLVSLLFGILFTSLGILGQYIGRTYIQSKNRPRYIIEKVIGRK